MMSIKHTNKNNGTLYGFDNFRAFVVINEQK